MLVKPYFPVIKSNVSNVSDNYSSIYPLKLASLQADVFHKTVSFGSKLQPDMPSEETMKYVEETKQALIKEKGGVTSLSDYDLTKIRDISAGIPVFEGLTINDIAYIANRFDCMQLQSGCRNGCIHCGGDPNKEIKTMKWDNFTRLADGIGELTRRLGFNPFERIDTAYRKGYYPEEVATIYPFSNSDPMSYCDQGHNIYNAASYFYEQTGTKFYITTAGWSLDDKTAQAAADGFVENPKCISHFTISIHPFDPLMVNSINCLEKSKEYDNKGNKEEAERLKNKSQEWRDKYIDKMANVIRSTLGLVNRVDYAINLLSVPAEATKQEGYSKQDSIELLEDIFKKLESDPLVKDLSRFAYRKDQPEERCHVEYRSIDPVGRAIKFFDDDYIKEYEEKNARIDISKLEEKQAKSYIENLPKIIGTNGEVFANNADFGDYRINRVELPKSIKLNFIKDNEEKINLIF